MERPKSEAAFAEAQKYIPGGVDSPVRALSAVGTTPIVAERAEGPYIWDVDGNRYTDLCMSWGVFLLGHNQKDVTRAAEAAVRRGSSFGMCTAGETRLAKLVNAAMPSMERLRFVSSGTEATMSAIRVARGFTGRDTLVKFEGCYHGHADHLLVSAGSAVANLRRASSAGVPEDFTRHTVCLPYNDTATFSKYMAESGDGVAAVIVEPVACNMGVVPPKPGFLEALRRETERHGAVLIFDEVITGFRLTSGGAQRLYGIRPDMTCVGKIVGGGFPAAAFGGRAEIMGMLAPSGPVYQAGTLSGNPVAMAAGEATLSRLSDQAVYDMHNERCERFFRKVESVLAHKKDVRVNHVGSMFTIFFNSDEVVDFATSARSDKPRFAKYFNNMLERGFYVSPSQFEGNFISLTHDDNILDALAVAIDESVE